MCCEPSYSEKLQTPEDYELFKCKLILHSETCSAYIYFLKLQPLRFNRTKPYCDFSFILFNHAALLCTMHTWNDQTIKMNECIAPFTAGPSETWSIANHEKNKQYWCPFWLNAPWMCANWNSNLRTMTDGNISVCFSYIAIVWLQKTWNTSYESQGTSFNTELDSPSFHAKI